MLMIEPARRCTMSGAKTCTHWNAPSTLTSNVFKNTSGSSGDDFFKTRMGQHIYEATVPKIADQLERLNSNIEALVAELRKPQASGRNEALAPPETCCSKEQHPLHFPLRSSSSFAVSTKRRSGVERCARLGK
jgi:hypothetical protein